MNKYLDRLSEIEVTFTGLAVGGGGGGGGGGGVVERGGEMAVGAAGIEEQQEKEEQPHLLLYMLEELEQGHGGKGSEGGGCAMDAAVWSGLPADMLERVLLMLPSATQLRFRAVCKKWRSMLSSPRFLDQSACLAFAAGPPICAYEYKPGRLRPEVEARNFYPRNFGPLLRSRHKVYKLDLSFVPRKFSKWKRGIERCVSHSGLLCIYNADWKLSRICICIINPVSRTWRELPPLAVPGMEDWDIILVAERRFKSSYSVVVIWNRGCSDAFQAPGYIGVYSSESRSWSTSECEPCLRNLSWRNCVVCDEFLYFHAKAQVVRHRISDGKCVSRMDEPHDWSDGYKDVFLVEQQGVAFWVDFIIPGIAESDRTCGVWRLNESSLQWEQVSVSPKPLIDKLKTPFLKGEGADASAFRLWLKKVVAAGDFIFLTICLESWIDDCCWTHLVGYQVGQQAWQILVYDNVGHPISDEFYFVEPNGDLTV